jgi:hypothetical protein
MYRQSIWQAMLEETKTFLYFIIVNGPAGFIILALILAIAFGAMTIDNLLRGVCNG